MKYSKLFLSLTAIGICSVNAQENISQYPLIQHHDFTIVASNASFNVADRVKNIIADQLGIDKNKITDNASFVDNLGADSLDTVELTMALEDEFGIEIPDEEAQKIHTVEDSIEYIQNHTQNGKK